ncbi:MAG: succinyl-diaminopimelate desuccinylase [Gammaproteobacteria bacterium]|nr:succinyl-diaminopimelate desuccinylase [Gammaproteobacteria bacterium]
MSSDNALDLLKQLIACPSLTPHDAGCQNLIKARLMAAGFTCETHQFEDVTNLWATYGSGAPLFVFAGHTDVVPTGPLTDWRTHPFTAVIENDHLIGRGACDMKGPLASMVVAAEQWVTEHPSFKGTIAFLLTSDEEGPALHGTRKMLDVLQTRHLQINYCIIGEPSSVDLVGDQIRVGRRGSLHGKLTVHGKQGHVAHPHLAENPIHRAARCLHELAHSIWDQGNADFPPTTFQITNLHSGTGALNIVPGHLESTFNFRFSTAITIDELKKRTTQILDQADLKYDLDWHLGGEPFLTQQGHLIKAAVDSIREITGLETKLSTGGGTSDGRFIAPTGAEVVELGPSHATAHQVNESIRVQDVLTLTKIYQSILNQLLIKNS